MLIIVIHTPVWSDRSISFLICVFVCLAEADGSPAWRRVWWEAEGAEREERAGIKASVSTGQGNYTVG